MAKLKIDFPWNDDWQYVTRVCVLCRREFQEVPWAIDERLLAMCSPCMWNHQRVRGRGIRWDFFGSWELKQLGHDDGEVAYQQLYQLSAAIRALEEAAACKSI